MFRDRVEEFAAQEVEWGAVVHLHFVERVGQDLGGPDESGLDVLDDEEVNGPEEDGAGSQEQPEGSE